MLEYLFLIAMLLVIGLLERRLYLMLLADQV